MDTETLNEKISEAQELLNLEQCYTNLGEITAKIYNSRFYLDTVSKRGLWVFETCVKLRLTPDVKNNIGSAFGCSYRILYPSSDSPHYLFLNIKDVSVTELRCKHFFYYAVEFYLIYLSSGENSSERVENNFRRYMVKIAEQLPNDKPPLNKDYEEEFYNNYPRKIGTR